MFNNVEVVLHNKAEFQASIGDYNELSLNNILGL